MKDEILTIIVIVSIIAITAFGTFVHTMNDIKVYPSNNENYVIVESCGQTWACDFIAEK